MTIVIETREYEKIDGDYAWVNPTITEIPFEGTRVEAWDAAAKYMNDKAVRAISVKD